MFYGTKEEFEQQKNKFMDVARQLWMTDPLYFKQSDYFSRITDVVRQIETEIRMNYLS